MLQIGDKVKIKPNKIGYYKRYAYSFMDLNKAGIVAQVMDQTAVVIYDSIGYNINKVDLDIVG